MTLLVEFSVIHNVDKLPPATTLGKGNIFRSVCQEFCPRRGGSIPAGADPGFGQGGAPG